jgi:hypothetical protein
MRCYQLRHRFYCGVDLHSRTMFVHILDTNGKTVFEQDLPTEPGEFLAAIEPFRGDLVVGCECMFAWYWLADLCADHGRPFGIPPTSSRAVVADTRSNFAVVATPVNGARRRIGRAESTLKGKGRAERRKVRRIARRLLAK